MLQPPLIKAIFTGDVEEVRLLLGQKEDVNLQDAEKRSPLHAASFNWQRSYSRGSDTEWGESEY